MLGFPLQHPARRSGTLVPKLEQLEGREVPALFAIGDIYDVAAGSVLTIPAPSGVLANDFSDTFPGSVLAAQLVQGAKYVGGAPPVPPLPAPNLFLNPDGSFTFIAPPANLIPAGVSQVSFTYNAVGLNTGEISAVPGVVTINIGAPATRFIATGAGAPGGPHVRVFEAGTSVQRFNFFPYEANFTGGVRVAVGDVNDDGVDDIATIPQVGGAPRLRVFDGRDGATIIDTFAFDPNFRGGGHVAIGDFNGNGTGDIIVGAGEGGGPHVQVFQLDPLGANGLKTLSSFFAYDGALRSGVRVAAGPLQRLGRDFIVTAPGAGGGSEIRVFDAQQVINRPIAVPVLSFFAAAATQTDGVYVTTGNLRGDGRHDIITGSGSGVGVVRVFDGRTGGLQREFGVPIDEVPTGGGTAGGPGTFSFQSPFNGSLLSPGLVPSSLVSVAAGNNALGVNVVRGGISVAAVDFDGDGLDDIITGNGPGNAPRVRIFNTRTQLEITSILAYSPTFLGGVNVAAD